LLAQDEMQVVQHPLLGCVREALLEQGLAAKTSDESGGTPILVSNVERRIEIATNPDASAATACTAFGAAVQESARMGSEPQQTVIHSGFWGCGAFGGNRRLMIAMQGLAGRAANVGRFVIHAGDSAGADEAHWGLDVAQSLAQRCGPSCSLDTIVGRTVMLAYRWGVSDGN